MDIANLTISSLTLMFTILGVIISLNQNKYSLDLTHLHMYKDRGKYFVDFRFINNSSRSVKITSVNFFSNQKKLPILDFDPAEYDQEKDKVDAKLWEKEHSEVDPLNPCFKANPYKMVNHAPNEYDFYHQVIFPTVVHSDSDLKISTYLSQRPDTVVITFNRRICIKLKFGFFPVFTDNISATLHNQQQEI